MALTNSLRATRRGPETIPLEGIAWSAVKVCNEVLTDSASLRKTVSAGMIGAEEVFEEEDILAKSNFETRFHFICEKE